MLLSIDSQHNKPCIDLFGICSNHPRLTESSPFVLFMNSTAHTTVLYTMLNLVISHSENHLSFKTYIVSAAYNLPDIAIIESTCTHCIKS